MKKLAEPGYRLLVFTQLQVLCSKLWLQLPIWSPLWLIATKFAAQQFVLRLVRAAGRSSQPPQVTLAWSQVPIG